MAQKIQRLKARHNRLKDKQCWGGTDSSESLHRKITLYIGTYFLFYVQMIDDEALGENTASDYALCWK